MKYYSQRNSKWAKVQLGFGNTTIGSHGCFITALSMMVEIEPHVVNDILKKALAFNGDLLISDKAAFALGLELHGTSATQPTWEPSVMEVDMSPSAGKQQHFVVVLKDKIIDPWTGTERPLNTYPKVSYRLFKNLNTTMNEDFVKEVSKLCDEDYGANLNENEQKDAAKKLKEYRETYNSDEIQKAILSGATTKEIEMQAKLNDEQKAYDDLVDVTNEEHNSQQATIRELERTILNLKDKTPYIWNGDAFQSYNCDSTDDMTDVEYNLASKKIIAWMKKLFRIN